MKHRPTIAHTNRLKDYAINELLRLLRRICGTDRYTSVPYRRLALCIGLPCVMLNPDHTQADNSATIATLRGGLNVLQTRGDISVKPSTHDSVLVRLRPPAPAFGSREAVADGV